MFKPAPYPHHGHYSPTTQHDMSCKDIKTNMYSGMIFTIKLLNSRSFFRQKCLVVCTFLRGFEHWDKNVCSFGQFCTCNALTLDSVSFCLYYVYLTPDLESMAHVGTPDPAPWDILSQLSYMYSDGKFICNEWMCGCLHAQVGGKHPSLHCR